MNDMGRCRREDRDAGNGHRSYLHESRHRYAAKLPRGLDDRFLSATDNAVLDSSRKRKAALDNKNDVNSKRDSE
jgi:CCAAT-binding transcription factor (CBF-B/NF-YA) subunit B